MFNINGWEFVFVAILFLLLFGPEKLPVVIVEGMKMFRQLRSAAEQATDEIRREFEAAASEIEAAKAELTAAADEVQRFGTETRALVDDAQRTAVTGEIAGAPPPAPDDASILSPGLAEALAAQAGSGEGGQVYGAAAADPAAATDVDRADTDVPPGEPADAGAPRPDDIDPAAHAIEAMGGPRPAPPDPEEASG